MEERIPRRGRPFVFPDPAKMSKAHSSKIVESAQILGLYNQETGDNSKYVTEKVQTWFKEKAESLGWHEAEFIGNQCVLRMNF